MRALALGLILSAGAAARADFTAQEWAVLKTGKVIAQEVFQAYPDGTVQTQVEVKAWIKVPRAQVWKILRDYNHFFQFMPNVRQSKILKQEGETYWVIYQTQVLWVKVIYYQILAGDGQMHRIDITMDHSQPNDIRDTRGYWVLDDAPDGKGTIATYSDWVSPGFKIPEKLARKVSKPGFIHVIENTRLRAESDGAWIKSQKYEINSPD